MRKIACWYPGHYGPEIFLEDGPDVRSVFDRRRTSPASLQCDMDAAGWLSDGDLSCIDVSDGAGRMELARSLVDWADMNIGCAPELGVSGYAQTFWPAELGLWPPEGT